MRLKYILNKFRKKQVELTGLQRLSLYFYQRPRKTALIALVIVFFGAASYLAFLKKEGFPALDTPYALAGGSYIVNDAAKVDSEVAEPLSNYLLKQNGVKSVTIRSLPNGYSAQISFEDGIDSEKRAKQLQENVVDQKVIPETAELKIDPFKVGYTQRGDNVVISLYDKNNDSSTETLTKKAERLAVLISDADIEYVEKVSSISQFQTGKNLTGQSETSQKTFERYVVRKDEKTKSYDAALVGIQATDQPDKLKLYDGVNEKLSELIQRDEFKGFDAEISASDKPSVEQQIDELQTSLVEGLIAVLVVGTVVIAARASLITVLAMIAVIAAVNAVLYLIGYSLNTMTLFALILSLSLIVDDTIIMVEAIEAQRRKYKKGDDVIAVSTGKVAQAMIAATSTAALSFAPLLFVGGVIGTFVKAIPITIILALFVSLVVALVLIPLLARYLLLSKSQMERHYTKKRSESSVVEQKIAEFIAKPMLKARDSAWKLTGVGLTAVVISGAFIAAGVFIASHVQFNIFPPAKDTNKLQITITMPDGASLEKSKEIASKVTKMTSTTLNDDFTHISNFDQANSQSVTLAVDLVDYKKRDRTSVQAVKDLNYRFEEYKGAKEIDIRQIDAGPPPSSFSVRIDTSDNREKAIQLARDIQEYLDNVKLKRADGTKATFESVSVSDTTTYARSDNDPYVSVTGVFKDKDTSTLVNLAEKVVQQKFSSEKVAEYDLSKDAISFNAGQEDDNQDSFATMVVAFPIVLAAIYILLATQFRSLLQPLLIFMAIPFSFLGVTLGLYLSNNPFSFFAMMGFFALIGLSIKNTILLTDYANQERRQGAHPIDAIHGALAERFRPLIATSLTAVVSLIPLALSSPFWEGLAVVLMGGLLSSTFLVVTVFPYYYLGAEFLRIQFSKRVGQPFRQWAKSKL